MPRRTLALAALAFSLAVTAASASARPLARAEALPPNAVFVVSGHGWGHGVGMSQYGALGYAQHGSAFGEILAHYYPATELGPAPASKVRVLLTQGRKSLTVTSRVPFKVRDGAGAAHDLEPGSYTFGPGLTLKLAAGRQALPGPLVFQPGGSPLQLRHPYRGTLQVDVQKGKLRVINTLGLEQYLYGVVPAEMPHSWSAEALKAQAVVARSYALATRKTGAFDLYPDTRSQVYLGLDHEFAESSAAVDATAGQVLLYDGRVATTYFFSTSGGRTAAIEDAFPNGEPVPYLVSVPDPYDTISPYHSWGPVSFSGAKLAKALHLRARVTDLQPVLNGSGRVSELTALTGKDEVAIPGAKARRLLGLRSTWFSVGALALERPAGPITYGSQLRLSGVARGIVSIQLQQRAGTSWEPISQLPARDGAVTALVKPAVTTTYRLATTHASTGPVSVQVAPRVRLVPPTGTTELSGTVRPVLAGARVQVQRLDGTAWRVVGGAELDDAGAFTARLDLVSGTYRARIAPGRGFVPGVSPALRVGVS
jgi:stage II sporulation protein D